MDELIYGCDAMNHLIALADRFAQKSDPVLVLGETGTGKELIARRLHDRGRGAGKPYRPVNCGAMPESLIEAELFGHVKGAFTGAERDSPGLFRSAHGGTLFLDEIGELPLSTQAKLLRVLQEGAVRPVGAAREEPVDVRVVAATNRDLRHWVAAGRFREDLFHRLAVLTLEVPPLRDRPGDIELLAREFLRRRAAKEGGGELSLTPEALRELEAFAFPGNVRELENVLKRAAAVETGRQVTPASLNLPRRAASPLSLACVRHTATRPCVLLVDDREERFPVYRKWVLEAVGVSDAPDAQFEFVEVRHLEGAVEEAGRAPDRFLLCVVDQNFEKLDPALLRGHNPRTYGDEVRRALEETFREAGRPVPIIHVTAIGGPDRDLPFHVLTDNLLLGSLFEARLQTTIDALVARDLDAVLARLKVSTALSDMLKRLASHARRANSRSGQPTKVLVVGENGTQPTVVDLIDCFRGWFQASHPRRPILLRSGAGLSEDQVESDLARLSKGGLYEVEGIDEAIPEVQRVIERTLHARRLRTDSGEIPFQGVIVGSASASTVGMLRPNLLNGPLVLRVPGLAERPEDVRRALDARGGLWTQGADRLSALLVEEVDWTGRNEAVLDALLGVSGSEDELFEEIDRLGLRRVGPPATGNFVKISSGWWPDIPPPPVGWTDTAADWARDFIIFYALQDCQGSAAEARKVLGMPKSTLARFADGTYAAQYPRRHALLIAALSPSTSPPVRSPSARP